MMVQKCPHCGITSFNDHPIIFGNVTLEDKGVLVFERTEMTLPRVQHQIVQALVAAKGRALTRAHLADWLDGEVFDQSIAVYVARVRSTFRQIDPSFDQIFSVRGFAAYKWLFKPLAQ
ncbi:winged helix-turn-helix domain-containing protein [Erythrobacter donghaensis]|uniref:winged helix-turn-helix domain-containing protein n=1 Tax=Erythrobacter donghaensis TaxID=267135 RepID=UPI000A3CE82C|nr:helix-turn-helix domain-containing protein [Erythrobacter donghaensis]